MEWRLKRTVAPPEKPVTVSELKEQTRIDINAEDNLLERLINAATSYVEGPYGIGVCLVEQTWEMVMDYFPVCFDIPLYPVQSVDKIEYIDQAGDMQTVDSSIYRVDTHSNPARVSLEWNEHWPTIRYISHAVTVTFVAGYEPDGSDYQKNIPDDLRHAIMMIAAHWYNHREAIDEGKSAKVPMTVDAILDQYRVPGVG